MVVILSFEASRDLEEPVGLDDRYMVLQLQFPHRSKEYISEGFVSQVSHHGLARELVYDSLRDGLCDLTLC